MRPPTRHTLNARLAARVFLAAALAFAVVTGAIPLGTVFGAHACSMPCCKGADGMPGDCTGGSCPVSHLGKAKAKPVKPAPAEPSCHTGGESASHTSAAGMHHSTPEHASPHEPDKDKVEHSSPQHVSTRDTATEPAFSPAAFSKPCPPGCGGLLNASTQLRRSRDEATLSDKLRPRPPTVEVQTQESVCVARISYALRRQYPPRPPPSISTSRPAA